MFPAFFGTVLQYYDYALYGFGAPLIAEAFFPKDDPTVALLKTFAVFMMGFVAKPLGSIFFGSLGDRLGRVVVLRITLLGIVLPTLFIGLLPNYSQIGWMSTALLILCRFFQGFFVAGESDGARLFLIESFQHRPCFMNSLSWVSTMIGIGIAALVFDGVSYIKSLDPAAYEWIWRIPFILGGCMGLVVLWSRQFMTEPKSFSTKNTSPKISLFQLVSHYYPEIIIGILICGSTGAAYHFYFIFWEPYLRSILQISADHLHFIKSYSVILFTLCLPCAGILSDRFGPKPILKYSALSLLICILPLNAYMLHQQQMSAWIFLLSSVVLAFFSVPGFVILADLFPIKVRFRGTSLGHSLGSLLFSGSTPFISLWIANYWGNKIAPLYYFATITGGILLALWLINIRSMRTVEEPLYAKEVV